MTAQWTSRDRVMVDGRPFWADEARLPLDPHLLRADGCFETALVVSDGPHSGVLDALPHAARVLALDLHLDRLTASLEHLRLFEGTTALRETVVDEVARLLAEAPPSRADRLLRITVTPGLRLLELRALPERVHLRRTGLMLHPLLEPRHDGLTTRHKTLAWSVHAAAARQHPRSSEPAFEGVWLDEHRLVLEGTATNLFVVRANRAATPPLARPILPGTARARTINALLELGLEVHERDLTERDLIDADAVIATSALLLAAPALSYADHPLRQAPEGLLASLVARLRG